MAVQMACHKQCRQSAGLTEGLRDLQLLTWRGNSRAAACRNLLNIGTSSIRPAHQPQRLMCLLRAQQQQHITSAFRNVYSTIAAQRVISQR
jgi:hypothetical protein